MWWQLRTSPHVPHVPSCTSLSCRRWAPAPPCLSLPLPPWRLQRTRTWPPERAGNCCTIPAAPCCSLSQDERGGLSRRWHSAAAQLLNAWDLPGRFLPVLFCIHCLPTKLFACYSQHACESSCALSLNFCAMLLPASGLHPPSTLINACLSYSQPLSFSASVLSVCS